MAKYYVFDDALCKFESMTKEEILAAITQAVESHEIADVDTGFVTTLKEQNRSTGLKFWAGTTAEYNALQTKDSNTFYILTDDAELDDLEALCQSIQSTLNTIATNIGSEDTGWIDITRQTLEAVEETIGRYRVVGKIAFFDFEYYFPDFPSNNARQGMFQLPIRVSAPISGQAEFGKTYCGINHISENDGDTILRIQLFNYASGMTWISVGCSNADIHEVSFSISCPLE